MNERRRIELALPLIGIVKLVDQGVFPKTDPVAVQCMTETMAAIDDVKAGLTGTETTKLWGRVQRALATALPLPTPAALKLDAYGLFYMLKVVTDADYFKLGDGDAYRRAVEEFLRALSAIGMSDHEMVRARSKGRQMLQTLQALGYYRGVDWPDRFDD